MIINVEQFWQSLEDATLLTEALQVAMTVACSHKCIMHLAYEAVIAVNTDIAVARLMATCSCCQD